ncbi:MAG TPA: twin-arginine translocase subunit TatC [Candidatus Acidoferrales bacterium]|nr:twin-arginine translocase subunit TatC [Candidatus Acidoferrales bacterium]
MPLTAHLEELRSRLIKSLVALVVGFAVCFAFVERIFEVLIAPLARLQVKDLSLIGTAVPEAFVTKLKVAFLASLVAALPVILWQAWQFVAPGLYEHERRPARYFVFFGTFFFLLGAAFCYEIVFPASFNFFLSRYQAIQVRPAIRIGEYLAFSSKLLIAFGVCFEMPVVAYFLARVGLIDHRSLLRHFRYAIIGIFILAAILTPPDVLSQTLLALPLTLLYGVSILTAYVAARFRRE